MPKKRMMRRKRRYRKKGYKRRYTLSRRQIFKLNKLQYPERKFHPVSIAQSSLSDTSTTVWLNQIGYGTQDNQRIGDKITASRLTGNIHLYGQTINTTVRIMLFWYNSPKGDNTLPPGTDLVDNPTRMWSLRNVDHVPHYKVFYDKVIVLGTNGQNGLQLRFNIPLRRLVSFAEDNTTPEINGLMLYAWSDQSVVTPLIGYAFKFWYTDA